MRLLRNKWLPVWVGGLGLCGLFWALFGLIGDGGSPLKRLNTLVFDAYQVAKPRTFSGSDIVIVDIDEQSLQRLGQWPWPRTELTRLTRRLKDLGAAVVVFDMVFAEPDRTSPVISLGRLRKAGVAVNLPGTFDPKALDHDRAFAAAIAELPVVTGLVLSPRGTEPPRPKAGTGVSGTLPPRLANDTSKAVRNLVMLDEAATGIGEFSFQAGQQSDAVVRTSILLRPVNGLFYPSLASEALRVAQGAGSFKIKMTDGSGEVAAGSNAVVSAQIGALTIPTDADGGLMVYHSPSDQKPVVAAHRLLSETLSAEQENALRSAVQNHIVLIGTSAAGLLDLRATPLEPVVAGVSIHADIIDQMIAGPFLTRPDWIPGLELTAALLAVAVVLVALPLTGAVAGGFFTLVLMALIVAGFWQMFSNHYLVASPLVAGFSLVTAYIGGTAANLLITERQRKQVRSAFGRYLAPAMVDRLAGTPEALKLGGEDKELTLLFCDIRGFTSLSEGLAPTELTNLLNRFLTPMTTALLDRGATIDKYMGDAIMAFWNAPLDQKDHRQLACEGLLDMRTALEKLNAGLEKPIDVGIGLNSGLCCVGNLGSTQRFNYSAIGDAVNVASRVEGQTKLYGLDNLVAAETLEGVSGLIALQVDTLQVVGRDTPLTVWTLLGRETELNRTELVGLMQAHAEMLAAFKVGDASQGTKATQRALTLAKQAAETDPLLPDLQALYALYAARFEQLHQNGTPQDWDGIYRATNK
ncbi:MAG: adenylate/guanylate cyclase domain-containing protein [Pseudomonadota bacterium]